MLVPNQPLREAFQRSDFSPKELAKILGYWRTERKKYRTGDGATVRRALGLKKEPPCRGGKFRVSMQEPTALKYAKALNLDPADVGL